MQVKFKRYSEAGGGLFGNKTSYRLDILLLPDAEEAQLIDTYGQAGETPSMQDIDPTDDSEMWKAFPKLSIAQLQHGAQVQYPDFVDVIRTEREVRALVERVLTRIELLETFDGSERVYDVTPDGSELLIVD